MIRSFISPYSPLCISLLESSSNSATKSTFSLLETYGFFVLYFNYFSVLLQGRSNQPPLEDAAPATKSTFSLLETYGFFVLYFNYFSVLLQGRSNQPPLEDAA
eukprot:c25580_g3_i4 orf=453-761(+)